MKRIMYIMLICAMPLTQVQAVIVPPPVIVQPDNFVLPTSAGELFSFDLVISSDPAGILGQASHSTISVSGLGGLTLDPDVSGLVRDDPDYWLYQNSFDSTPIDHLDGSCTFGDLPLDGYAQTLATNNIVARYTFIWDGTPGWPYTFTLDPDILDSFFMLDDFISYKALQLPDPGTQWWDYPIISADETSFTIVPEPTTLMLLGLGSMAVLRKRALRKAH